jgi:hypothetical protein
MQFKPTPGPDEIRRLQRLFSGAEPPGAGAYIAVPQEGQPYAKGTMLPQLGLMRTATTAGGVVVAIARYPNEPMKYVQLFLGLDEYLGVLVKKELGVYNNDNWINLLLGQQPREQVLVELAFLNNSLHQPDLLEQLMNQYRAMLPAALGENFDRAMAAAEVPRVFLARQPILRAIRDVILYTGPMDPILASTPHSIAIMLAHALATKVGSHEETGPELWPTARASTVMEVIQNNLFNRYEDIYARLDRYTRLWDDYGKRLSRTKLRADPGQLIVEATGIERADLFSVAFSLMARVNNWKPGPPFNFDPYSGIGMDRATLDAALATFTAEEATLVGDLKKAPADWQMLPFERYPVLRLSDSTLLVLDRDYLLERVTSGLYWIVLDHEFGLPGGEGKKAANLWSQAYSEMIEALAEDSIKAMAPPLLSGTAGKTFYTEEDFAAAYHDGTRRCDAAIDFGHTLLLFEVQKGQVSLDTRQTGLIDKFFSDTERMVLAKAQQLDGTAKAVLADEAPLTGISRSPSLRILPVAVQGATYPVNPITDEWIKLQLKDRRLLTDARVGRLAVVDLGELEMLEGLADHSVVGVTDALATWKTGPDARFALRNHLLQAYGGDVFKFRPKRMTATVDSINKTLIERLKVERRRSAEQGAEPKAGDP